MEALDLLCMGAARADAVAVTLPEEGAFSYREIRDMSDSCRAALNWPAKALVAVDEPRSLPGLLGYLAAMSAGHAVLLVEGRDPVLWDGLLTIYQPDLLVTPPRGPLAERLARTRYVRCATGPLPVWYRVGEVLAPAVHPELGMLIRTSGSLGPPKMVRLSYRNLHANAIAIAAALALDGGDRAVTSLPLDFSFGLSMVNSAFAAAGSVALSTWSASSELFWRYSDHAGGTCVGAVPATLRFLRDRGWDPSAHSRLRLLLHAGGALGMDAIDYFSARMAAHGGEFVSMYGQTEATARIACLRGPLAAAHSGSAGVAVPGTRVTVRGRTGAEVAEGEIGEIVVDGPGVMMGYATGRTDLAHGDQQGGTLRTGDLGYLRDGLLYVTGRKDRQVKIFGHRINLDQVETALSRRGIPAAVEAAGADRIVVIAENQAGTVNPCRELARQMGLPATSVCLLPVPSIPRTRNGKVDRRAVARIAEAHR